jgi:hypothetical protein
MADFEYSITPIPLTVAGGIELHQEGDYLAFLSALDASGAPSLDARLDVAFGRVADDYAPFFPNSKAKGYFPKVRIKWAAQAGLTAYIYISREPALQVETPPAKQLVTSAIASGFSHGAVSVGTVATLIKAANSNRQALTVQNLSPGDVYLGGATVTVANGLRLSPGELRLIEKNTGAVYGIVASGTADVRYMEEA